MKKLLAIIIAIASIMVFSLTGCNGVTRLQNVGGDVISGNGTFAVERGDYLYFINGVGDYAGENKLGKVEKGSLLRVKLDEIGSSTATIETVIPKLVSTKAGAKGVYFFGNTVYFGSPYDGKDKKGDVREDYFDFQRFDLEKAKMTRIVYETNTVDSYYFAKNGDKVYLVYKATKKIDDSTNETFLRVVDASNGEEVFLAEKLSQIALPADDSGVVYYSKIAYSEALKQDEVFENLYSYSLGAEDSALVLSGAGSSANDRDGNKDIDATKKVATAGSTGVTFSLIKNTGKVLVYKITSTDANYPVPRYYYADYTASVDNFSTATELGVSNEYIDRAIVSTAYYKSANEIYYVESSTYVAGLVKFDYTKATNTEHGRTLVNEEAASMSIISVEGGVMYLCNGTNGYYYKLNYLEKDAKCQKINGIPMKTANEWFAPRIIGNKFIGSYSGEYYYNYVYVIDMTGLGSSEYEDALEELGTLSREKLEGIKSTLLGKMTEADATALQEKIDTNYPEEETED